MNGANRSLSAVTITAPAAPAKAVARLKPVLSRQATRPSAVKTWFITKPRFQSKMRICTNGETPQMMASGIARILNSADGALRKNRPPLARISLAKTGSGPWSLIRCIMGSSIICR